MTNEQNDKVEDVTESTGVQRAAELLDARRAVWADTPSGFKVTRQQKRAAQRSAAKMEKRNG